MRKLGIQEELLLTLLDTKVYWNALQNGGMMSV